MTILITGATGTIGRHLIDSLTPDRQVRTFGRTRPDADIEHVSGSITDVVAVGRAAVGVNTIVHLAGVLEGQDPLKTLEVNLRGTYHVLEAARRHGVARVVVASSIAATGCLAPDWIPRRVPIRESDPCRPVSPYAASKFALEILCDTYSQRYGITTVALRVAGVRAQGSWLEPPWETVRSPILWTWISVRDASRAFRSAIDVSVDGSVVAHVAASDTCSWRQTDDLTADFLQGTIIDRPDESDDDPRWPLFDLDRARRLLGWEALDRFVAPSQHGSFGIPTRDSPPAN